MYCSYCGSKNEEGSKFCSSCGKELLPTQKEEKPKETGEPLHNSIVRKSIKKDAMSKNKGPLYAGYILSFVLVFIVLMILAFTLGTKTQTGATSYSYNLDLTTASLPVSIISGVILLLVMTFLSTGMAKSSLDISRDEQTTVGNIFSYPIKNIKTFLKILGINIIAYIILTAISRIPFLGAIAYLILIVYFTPPLAMLTYIVIEDENITVKDAITKALNLTKGHRVEYYGLVFSYIGWFILSIFTIGLLFIWIAPYLNVAISNFYLYITKEKEYTGAQQGISNGLIIGLTIGGYIVFILVITIMIFLGALAIGGTQIITEGWDSITNDDYYDYDYDYDYDNHHDYTKGETVNVSGLEIYIPDDYNKIDASGYDEAYTSSAQDIMIGLITYDIGYSVTANDYANIYRESLASSYSCGNVSTNPINGYNWEVLDCFDSQINVRSYVTIDSGKLYVLAVTYEKNQNTNINNLYSQIENELAFANTVA